MSPFRFRFSLALLGTTVVPAGVAVAQVAVTTTHNDNARSGLNARETTLTPSNVNVARFGKLFSRQVDGKIWGQPLYVPGVAVAGKGTRNVVYVVTEQGTAYAFDADNAAETAPLWKAALLPGPFTDARWKDQNVSSPVIDAASSTIYFTLKNLESSWVFRLFALDLRTGVPKAGSGGIITASVPGSGKGSSGGKLTFNPSVQKQRPSLLLSGGQVYVAFGGSVDEYDPYVAWNGWIFAYDAVTLARKQVFCVAPNGNGGGIWQAGNGLAADAAGNIYALTSNGNGMGPNGVGELFSFTAASGGVDYGNSMLKLSLQSARGSRAGVLDADGKRLEVSDYWTPYNWKYIEVADQDLGSSGTLLIPGTSLAITGDKSGRMYVVNTQNMGHFLAGANSQIVTDFQAWRGHLHGGPVYFNSAARGAVVYGWAEHDYLKAYRVADLSTKNWSGAPTMQSSVAAPPGMPGGFLSVSSNGTQNGIVWAYMPYVGDANQNIVPGVLRAFDANDLTRELWNSDLIASRDDCGLFSKFSNPTVTGGKVYLSTFSNQLVVYGLLPGAAVPGAPAGLSAAAAIGRVNLSWNAVNGATSYSVQRATTAGGPYAVVADNLTAPSYEDSGVQNGTRYFYIVTANNAGGASGPSNEANATPYAAAPGTAISLNFRGGATTAMGTAEEAGVVAATNWNDAAGAKGMLSGLRFNGGAASGAAANWTSLGVANTDIADAPGNNRLMRGFLSNDNTSATSCTVNNIPASVVSAGYDVYVYSDGVNPTATRTVQFALSGATQSVTDAQNRNFEGTFSLPGVANVGNYLVFKNVNSSSFTLAAVQGASTDTTPRAPLNGLQIVAHQSAPVAAGAPVLAAQAGNAQVGLSWSAVSGASSYLVKRAAQPGGPYTTLATVSGLEYGDASAQNGDTYFYVVSASNGGNASNEVAATPLSGYAGASISLDFGGGQTPAMDASENAGAPGVSRSKWNRTFYQSGGLGSLVDSKGTVTSAAATWNAEYVGDTSITDGAGSKRMMRGYISGNTGAATVNLYGLPSAFTTNGYDVYVYGDNNNGGARVARYSIENKSVTLTDGANKQFSNYVLGNNGTGNYIKLIGFKNADFTLSALPVSTADGVNAAPLNGVQIVARQALSLSTAPRTLSTSPTTIKTAAGTAQNLSVVVGDKDGADDIAYVYTRVATDLNDAAPLDVYYNGAQNKLYLYDGAQWIGGYAPGSANVISGPRGSLNCAKTSVSRQAGLLTIGWNLTPSTALVGAKWVWNRAQDKANHWESWGKWSSWTISAPAITNSAPNS